MNQPSVYFKRNALNALRGKWVIAVVALLVASILGGVSSDGISFNFNIGGSDSGDTDVGNPITSFQDLIDSIPPGMWTFFLVAVIVSAVVGLVLYVIGGNIEVGYRKFNLDLVDRKNAELGSLFSYFSHWKNNFLARLLRDIYIFLWSLLFIIPGIVAGYSYALVPYLLAENPEMPASEAIASSKKLMYGHRGKLFILRLSFIGWYLLTLLTCGIASPVVSTYQNAAEADFFRELTGTRPQPEVGGFGVPPYGTPYGQGGVPPYGTPYGQGGVPPYGTPYGQGNVPPTGNATTPETPAETPAEAPVETPTETPTETPAETPAATKESFPELPDLPDLPDVSEITVDPDSKNDN